MKKLTKNGNGLATILLGVAIGGAIGITLGILFAPDKGIQTRKKHAVVRQRLVGFVKKRFSGLTDRVADMQGASMYL